MAVAAGPAQAEPRPPMAREEQQWLSEAVSEALGTPGSVRAELQRCLGVLAGPCPAEAAPERGLGDSGGHEGALAQLGELCESLDVANDFCSLGGLEVLLELLGHRWPPLRAGAARLLGVCAQNLPEAQGRALALGALPALLGGLRGDPDPRVPPAALFAVSCLVRAQPQGLEQLEALGGLEVLGGGPAEPPPPPAGPRRLPAALPAQGAPPASQSRWCSRAWWRSRNDPKSPHFTPNSPELTPNSLDFTPNSQK
ncbi:hsp70-binding protein 1-like isoform X7 [Passer domesticus]|uniref:hsp70-binding protein 1-like isoform X7 n=1 Tax=Passer domesticus TaxID=48849 RepID=UPI0030FE0A1F